MKEQIKKLGFITIFILVCMFSMSFISGCDFTVPQDNNDNSSSWGNLFTIETAYAAAQDLGYSGSLQDFLDSISGKNGEDGKSAYELAQEDGYNGTKEEWLSSLVGRDGKSAYDIAKEQTGNEDLSIEAWLESLVGAQGVKGEDGKSAYQIAVDNGFTGTETEWLNSLKESETGKIIGISTNTDKWNIVTTVEVVYINENGVATTFSTDEFIVNIKPNQYYLAEDSNDIYALINCGVEKIKLAKNVHLVGNQVGLSIKNYEVYRAVFNKDLQIDLNSHALILDDAFDITISDDATVIFKNGNIERVERIEKKVIQLNSGEILTFEADKDILVYSDPAMKIENGAKLTLDNVVFSSYSGSIHVYGKSILNVINRSQVFIGSSNNISFSGAYGISTNASTIAGTSNPMDYDITINIDNSIVKTTAKISTGILFNVPGNLNINNSTISGNIQAVVIRGGKSIISNSTLNCTGIFPQDANLLYENYGEWSSGSCVPFSTLVVGNTTKSYQYPTECTLINCTLLKANRDTTSLITVAGNAGNGNGIGTTNNNWAGTWIGAILAIDNLTVLRSDISRDDIKTYNGNENCYKIYGIEMD